MTFKELTGIIEEISSLNHVGTTIIGESVRGRPIYAFHIGEYQVPQIIITAAIHAREWITALLVIELIKLYRTQELSCGIYFVPLCNPDGVEIALDTNHPLHDPLWKANAHSVDLNVNFDADWGTGAQNSRVPGAENFIGPHPQSEPEVQALVNFTRTINPSVTIAYHSKGEVIYYGFEPLDGRTSQEQIQRDHDLAQKIGKITGYTPIKTENSAGGYSDWVSMHFGVPALTIEVGCDTLSHPIGVDKIPVILSQNIKVPKVLQDYIIKS